MRRVRTAALLAVISLCGCVMFEVGVTNPVAGLTTVAVVPFFNLSEERSVDGRRFAQAYFSELQKTPGFQVMPVGVVEQAMHDHKLQMAGTDDALKLAELLHVDAVVVGAVTDYSPYYPPRLGLQISWYSPRPWSFVPGMPVDANARNAYFGKQRWKLFKSNEPACPPGNEPCPPADAMRGQSPDVELRNLGRNKQYVPFAEDTGVPPSPMPVLAPLDAASAISADFDPRLPLMSYTRLFDGADPKLTARLRDYVELSGDLRSGGWQSYLQRSEDFIRFTAHLMIVEMLQLHGGEAKRRVVMKWRRYP